jgi:hypothetical protein
LLLGCGRATGAAQVHRQTKGGFVNSRSAGSWTQDPSALVAVQLRALKQVVPAHPHGIPPPPPQLGLTDAAVRTSYPVPRIPPVPTRAEARVAAHAWASLRAVRLSAVSRADQRQGRARSCAIR